VRVIVVKYCRVIGSVIGSVIWACNSSVNIVVEKTRDIFLFIDV
jgi:hypothetical protein